MKQTAESSSKDIKKAAQIIKNGGVIVFPTDTVYGIGCSWETPDAVSRIYQIKKRPLGLSFPILINHIDQLKKVAIITPLAQKLIDRYWPGGLTIVLNLRKSKFKVGFRIPNSTVVQELISLAKVPIIGTSANFHGKSPVKSSKDLDPQLLKLIDFVIEGECKGGMESTVVDATDSKPQILRQGAINLKSLTLRIDTVKRENIEVELKDTWSKLSEKINVSQKTGSQALMPAIINILKKSGSTIKDISEIKVNTGPGSFTGTRIGVAVGNALGFALNVPVNGRLGKIAVPLYEKSKFD